MTEETMPERISVSPVSDYPMVVELEPGAVWSDYTPYVRADLLSRKDEEIERLRRLAEHAIEFIGALHGDDATIAAYMDFSAALTGKAEALGGEAGKGQDWRPMDTAPRDGTPIDAVGRWRSASAGFPRYVHFVDGAWRDPAKTLGEPVVCWAWRPRTEWPQPSAQFPESSSDGTSPKVSTPTREE